jgi:dihydrofolate reductase
MRISLIVAIAENGVIGRGNALPWRVSSDMRRFKALTMGKPIIMGRKQYQSVGRPLPGRDNIILTRDCGFRAPGCEVVHTIDAAIALAERRAKDRGAVEIMVIGGAETYRLAWPRAVRLYLSRIRARVEGDVRFEPDLAGWREISREEIPAGGEDEFAHAFIVYERGDHDRHFGG